jgi:DNA-binding MarR family transcriptional regulator
MAEPRSVLLELHNANQLVGALVSRRLLEAGVAPNLFAVLSLIDLHQPVTPTALATEGGYKPTTVRDMVNELVERGLVRRVENADDRRSHFLELTSEGERLIDSARPVLAAVEAELERELGTNLDSLRGPLAELLRASRSRLGPGG